MFSFLFSFAAQTEYITNFNVGRPKREILNYESFTVYKNNSEYKCFELPDHYSTPAKSVNNAVDEIYAELKNKCSQWKMGFNTIYNFCHFNGLGRIDKHSKTVIAKYNKDGFVYSDNAIKTTWKDEDTRVTIEYKCDIAAPHYGTIESLQKFTDNNYRITFVSPIMCQFENLKPSDVKTIQCYKSQFVKNHEF